MAGPPSVSIEGPIVVIGGGLAGMAAAARLAKLGHSVELFERSGSLGGIWAAYDVGGIVVEDAPGSVAFPAPWRDLFRKSGRPLEAELTRMGFELAPAEPAVYTFADGAELTLPTDRGAQVEALTSAYGRAPAQRWRDLVDRLDDTWQALRPLGLESELTADRSPDRRTRRRLLGRRRTLAGLAATLDHPHLTAMVRSIAYRSGSRPERTPAFAAVELAVQRTFGRWRIRPLDGADADGAGRTSVLVEALRARLELREVAIQVGVEVRSVGVRDGRVSGVVTDQGTRRAAAVISTGDPWDALGRLVPPEHARRTRRRLDSLRRAAPPRITHECLDEPPVPGERVTLDPRGVPTVQYRRPGVGGTIAAVHAFPGNFATPGRAAYGVAWQGYGSWLKRPPVSTELAGLFLAGPCSPAGSGASQVVLSGALAAYACHAYVVS